MEPRLSIYGKSIKARALILAPHCIRCAAHCMLSSYPRPRPICPIASSPVQSAFGSISLCCVLHKQEWDQLAEWVIDHNVFHDQVCWMIQVPRIFSIYK
jgi:hypothetical protein